MQKVARNKSLKKSTFRSLNLYTNDTEYDVVHLESTKINDLLNHAEPPYAIQQPTFEGSAQVELTSELVLGNMNGTLKHYCG